MSEDDNKSTTSSPIIQRRKPRSTATKSKAARSRVLTNKMIEIFSDYEDKLTTNEQQLSKRIDELENRIDEQMETLDTQIERMISIIKNTMKPTENKRRTKSQKNTTTLSSRAPLDESMYIQL